MSLWPVIRDLFIRKAAEAVMEGVIEEVVDAAQEASQRARDKRSARSTNRTEVTNAECTRDVGDIGGDSGRET